MRLLKSSVLALMLMLSFAGCDDSTEPSDAGSDSGAEVMDAGTGIDSGTPDSGVAEDAGHDAGQCVPAGGDCEELPCCDDLPCSVAGDENGAFYFCG